MPEREKGERVALGSQAEGLAGPHAGNVFAILRDRDLSAEVLQVQEEIVDEAVLPEKK